MLPRPPRRAVEKGQQLGGPQPGDARVWVDPHVEVAQAAPADGSLFRPVGASASILRNPCTHVVGNPGKNSAVFAIFGLTPGSAVMHVHHACAHYFFFGFEGDVLHAERLEYFLLPAASAGCSPRSHRGLRPGHSPPAHPHTGKTASGQIQTPCLSRRQQPHRVPTPPPSLAPGPPPAPAGR